MNVLMTGGEGYIGKGLMPLLGNLGVMCNTYDLKNNADIFDEAHLLESMKGMEGVIHLAGLRGPECEKEGFSVEDFEHINFEGSKAVFEAAHKSGIKRFAFSSSIEVYGFPSLIVPDVPQCTLPITDESPLPQNNHVYALMKLKTEDYYRQKSKEYGMTTVAIRFGGIDQSCPWGVSFNNLAKAFYLALTTDKVDGFDFCPVCDVDKKGMDLSRARKVLGYE